MISLKFLGFPALAFSLILGTSAQAATINVDLDLDLAYTSEHGIRSDTRTLSRDLVGMDFQATYTDGTTETWGWVQTGLYRAGTDHTSDDLTFDYHSSGMRMDATKRVASFTMDLVGANMIFDAGDYRDPDPRNSPTTKVGKEFDINVGADAMVGEVTASYSNRVQIGDHTTGEDAFTRLFVDFSGLANGGVLGAFTWIADTDVLEVAGDLRIVQGGPLGSVPLPAGGLLLISGFGALSLLGRRRRRAA